MMVTFDLPTHSYVSQSRQLVCWILCLKDCLCGMQLHTFHTLLLQLHCSDCSSDCVEARTGAHLLHSVGLQLPRQAARHLHLVRHGVSHQDWTGCNQLLLHVSTRG